MRIAVGLLGAGDIIGNGLYYHWYQDAFAGFTFRYYGFEWVHPLPEPFLSVYFLAGFGLGIAVALGWRFRLTAPLFAVCISYLFFLEKAHYLNHGYLFMTLCWLLCLTPCWREWSLDVARWPREWSSVAPAWSLYIFPLLMGVVYFYGGINKINHDWLIRAMPLHLWLERRAEMPLLGPVFAQKATAYVMAWGGMLLDLTAAFLLLHRRLRWVALGLLLLFHATNHLIFNIGIFPYLSLVLTGLFFEPDWPKRFVGLLARQTYVPAVARQVSKWRAGWQSRVRAAEVTVSWQQVGGRKKVYLLIPVVIFHLLYPLRHNLYDSDVNWSEVGHRYSWRMMLRSKQGYGVFKIHDLRSGEQFEVFPRDSLDRKQYRKMCTHPDMILQYAHHLRDQYAAAGREVAIYAKFVVRLNGRGRQAFLSDTVDLARTNWTWGDKPWVLPESTEE